MIVYIEDCLIENFVVTFLVLECVCTCFSLKVKLSNKLTSSITGALIAVFYPLIKLNTFCLIAVKLLAGAIIVICAFSYSAFWAKYFCFMFFTALYAGLNLMLYYFIYGTLDVQDNFPTYILLILLLLIYYMTLSILKLAKKKLAISNFVYGVKIVNDGKEWFAKGFLDSGNTLLDQDSTPIFIINLKLFNKLYSSITLSDLLTKNFKDLKNPHYVKSKFASGGAKILVFEVDRLQILENNAIRQEIANAKIGISYSKFAKNFDCDILLNICAFA